MGIYCCCLYPCAMFRGSGVGISAAIIGHTMYIYGGNGYIADNSYTGATKCFLSGLWALNLCMCLLMSLVFAFHFFLPYSVTFCFMHSFTSLLLCEKKGGMVLPLGDGCCSVDAMVAG